MEVFALIPARGGSKSVIRKNLQEINGVSLLEITIRQALKVLSPNRIYVSSDSEEILGIAKSLGCSVILRSSETASDEATADQVVKEFILQTCLSDTEQSVILYLQPTSPFRAEQLIQKGLDAHLESGVPIVAVSLVNQHPEKMLTLNAKGTLEYLLPTANPTANRQSLPKILIPTGSLYVFSVANFNYADKIPVNGAAPYFVSGVNSVDIDSMLDLKIAQEIGTDHGFSN